MNTSIPEVLFVCVHNAGRSQMAAALLERYAAGRVHIRSAGSEPASSLNPRVVEAMGEIGLDISREFRVLLVHDGSDIKVGAPAIDGIDVDAKVLAHSRGPRIETLRYKSKKRVRVHRGGRADYTALEILAVGGLTVATGTAVAETETKKPASRRRAAKAEVETAAKVEEKPKRAPRKSKPDDKDK